MTREATSPLAAALPQKAREHARAGRRRRVREQAVAGERGAPVARRNPKTGRFVPVSKSIPHRVPVSVAPERIKGTLQRFAMPPPTLGRAVALDGKRIRDASRNTVRLVKSTRGADHIVTGGQNAPGICGILAPSTRERGTVPDPGPAVLRTVPPPASVPAWSLAYPSGPGRSRAGTCTLLAPGTLMLHFDKAVTCTEGESLLEKNPRREKRLEAELLTLFEAEPLEDGLDHPADKTIGEVLQSTDRAWALRWVKALMLDASHPAFAASVLRCLGRQQRPGTVAWRVEIVRTALAADDVGTRDAAAQAAEAWGGSDMRRVLLAHSEPESWLRNYIEKIVEDLVT